MSDMQQPDYFENEHNVPETRQNLKKKRRGLGVAVVIACIVLLLVAIVAAAFALLDFYSTPTNNTLLAVFDSSGLFKRMEDKGGKVRFRANVASDIVEKFGEKTLKFEVISRGSKENSEVLLSMGEGSRLDIVLSGDEHGLEIGSNSLLGQKRYAFRRDNIREELSKSVFAPDSGTKYALPQDAYDALITALEQDSEDEASIDAAISRAVDNIFAVIEENAKVEKNKETVELIDGATGVTVYTCTLQEDMLPKLSEAVRKEWKENDKLREYIKDLMPKEQVGDDGEIQTADELIKQLEEAIEKLPEKANEAIKDLDGELVMKLAVKNGYMVSLTWELQLESTDGEKHSSNAKFSWTFAKNPKKNPSFRMCFVGSTDGKEEITLNAEYAVEFVSRDRTDYSFTVKTADMEGSAELRCKLTKDAETFTGSMDIDDKDSESEDIKIAFAGVLQEKRNSRVITLNSISVKNNEKTLFDINKSTFTLEMTAKKIKIKPSDDAENILAMSAESIDGMLEQIEAEYGATLRKINEEMEVELFTETQLVQEKASLSLSKEIELYAIDRKTGRLFVTVPTLSASELRVYDLKTSELLSTQRMKDPIGCMDADNGYLAYSYRGSLIITVCDAETLQVLKKIDMQDKILWPTQQVEVGNLIVDGDAVICSNRGLVCKIWKYSIASNDSKEIALDDNSIFTIDRKNHRLAAVNTGSSRCSINFYDTVSGEHISGVRAGDFYNYDGMYFNGKTFMLRGIYYYPDGKTATFEEQAKRQEDENLSMVACAYFGDYFCATIEQYLGGGIVSCIYGEEGDRLAMLNTLFVAWEDLGDSKYLAIQFDGLNYSAVTYRIPRRWIINTEVFQKNTETT